MHKPLFQAAAMLALLASAEAQAAKAKQCMTRAEVHGMVGYFLPSVLDSTIQTCASQAGSDSFLRTRGPQLVTELNQSRDASWPMARAAFGKFADSDADLDKVPDELIKPIIDEAVSGEISKKITARNCADVERVLGPLAPLPAPNMVDLMTELFVVAMRNDKEMPTCS
jgi:hypothetical protein